MMFVELPAVHIWLNYQSVAVRTHYTIGTYRIVVLYGQLTLMPFQLLAVAVTINSALIAAFLYTV